MKTVILSLLLLSSYWIEFVEAKSINSEVKNATFETMEEEHINFGIEAFPWLVEAIAHEWVHNYLSIQPLGINYSASSEMRSINETTSVGVSSGSTVNSLAARFAAFGEAIDVPESVAYPPAR